MRRKAVKPNKEQNLILIWGGYLLAGSLMDTDE